MKKAVVTGASGFIGKALTKRLLEAGYQVYAVVRGFNSLENICTENLTAVVCDFSHYSELSEKIDDDIDVFVHMAWAGVSGAASKDLSVQAENILASVTAIQQANLLGVKKFLFAGSSYQYRMEPVLKNGEKYFLPKNIYGAAKTAATRLLYAGALENGIEFNSVLFTNVFGVGDRSKRSTNSMLSQLLAGEALNLISGERLHDWTYIDDAVEGILTVLEKGIDGTSYYIGSRKLKTFQNIITQVRDIVAPTVELRFGHYEDEAFIDYLQIDLERLYRDTGFACQTDFDESIRKTAAWLMEERQDMEKAIKSNMSNNGNGGVANRTVVAIISPLIQQFLSNGYSHVAAHCFPFDLQAKEGQQWR